MNIPDKAVLAMIEQLGMTPDEIDLAHIQALESAAPLIAEQALRGASREYRARGAELFSGDHVARLLNARADEQVNP